jgi:hypothetical protein
MANSDDTIALIYFDEGVEKHHHRNSRWKQAFQVAKSGAERYGDGDFEYDSPLDMAIGTAKTMLNRPGVDEVQVFQGGELEQIVMQEPEKYTVLDPEDPRNKS